MSWKKIKNYLLPPKKCISWDMNVADRDGETDSATAGKGIDEKTVEAQE